MAQTYDAIASYTFGSAASSYTFSSIAASWTDLILVAQISCSAANNQIYVQVGNGSVDTGTNYSWTDMYGTGSTTASARYTSQSNSLLGYTDATTGSTDSNFITHFQNYSNTSTYKTFLSRHNSPARVTGALVGLWRSTSAINTIKLATGSGNFIVGSTLTLYGVKSA